jgi:hypothetical protein
MARNAIHFDVMPRYSCGSPAMVSEAQALKVVQDERSAYVRVTEGMYGAEAKAAAYRMGLYGIVWSWQEVGPERKGGRRVEVTDMGVDERRMFATFEQYRVWTQRQRESSREFRETLYYTATAAQ